MSLVCCVLSFWYQAAIFNEFSFPVTLHYRYFVVFQKRWEVFTVKKYYPLKVALSVWNLCTAPCYTPPWRLARARLLARARKPRSSSGWWFLARCPPARCAAEKKDIITFSGLQITCCRLPEAFTNGIIVSPINWINLPGTQLTGRAQKCQTPEIYSGAEDLSFKMQQQQQTRTEKISPRIRPFLPLSSQPWLSRWQNTCLGKGKLNQNTKTPRKAY